MKKIIIAGGSHSDVPMILAAKRLGFYVVTGGNRASDIGHAFADEFQAFDYSDANELAEVASRVGADALCACCNDFAAISCSIVARDLGLSGHDAPETAKLIHHKDLWRSFASKHDISTPRAIGCKTVSEAEAAIAALRFPLIVKPVDLTGGKGITRVNDVACAISAAKNAFEVSKEKRIVIEEFIFGSRHGFSCLLKDRRVVFYFADDEFYHLSEYLVSAACTPTSCRPESIQHLISETERVATLLSLVDGIFHVQFIQPAHGPPVIIEACRRPPGDLYVDLVRHATGVNYADHIVSAATGSALPPPKTEAPTRNITRHCLMGQSSGVFMGFEFSPSIAERIVDRLIWAKSGEIVSDPRTHKFGVVFVEHPNVNQMRREAPQLQKLLASKVV